MAITPLLFPSLHQQACPAPRSGMSERRSGDVVSGAALTFARDERIARDYV
jgi:hypothetical protein